MKTVPRSIAFRNFFGRRTGGRVCLAEGCVGRTLLSAALDYIVFVFTPKVVELWSVTFYAGSHTKSRATLKPGGQECPPHIKT
jgi:hypothetical protein